MVVSFLPASSCPLPASTGSSGLCVQEHGGITQHASYACKLMSPAAITRHSVLHVSRNMGISHSVPRAPAPKPGYSGLYVSRCMEASSQRSAAVVLLHNSCARPGMKLLRLLPMTLLHFVWSQQVFVTAVTMSLIGLDRTTRWAPQLTPPCLVLTNAVRILPK